MRPIQAIAVVCCSAALASLPAFAGGGPQNVLVVVNTNSTVSLDVGRYYVEKRGIPEGQIVRISVPTNFTTDTATFSNNILGPVLAHLSQPGLSNQIDYVVLTLDTPYRIFLPPQTNRRYAASSSSLYYGFFSSPNAFASGCDLASGSTNPYYAAETAFDRAGSPSSNRYIATTILSGYSLEAVKRMIDRSAGVDGTAPTGTVHLLHSTDTARNVTWQQFDEAEFRMRLVPGAPSVQQSDADFLLNVSNVLGCTVGVKSTPNLPTVGFLPGALADHLTSFGGCLLDAFQQTEDPNQMSILEWTSFGCAGSYGTVVEPCAYPQKFPAPFHHAWYARGFNLAETLYMSVQNPYQGATVGDPLTQPFAKTPTLVVAGLLPDQVVSGSITITGTAAAASGGVAVSGLDLFVDDLLVATVTNQTPRQNNRVLVSINSATSTYTVGLSATLASVAAGVANRLNLDFAFLRATATSDRVQVTFTNLGVSHATSTLSAVTIPHTAPTLTVHASTSGANIFDTTAFAREFVGLGGVASNGDLVRCVITLTNGVVSTNTVVATAGQSPAAVLGQLQVAINADTNLTAADGVVAKYVEGVNPSQVALLARTPGPGGRNLFVDFQVIPTNAGQGLQASFSFNDRFNDNDDVLGSRGMIFLHEGSPDLRGVATIDTMTLPDGPHEVMLVAYDGSAVKSQGRAKVRFVVDNNSVTSRITAPVEGHYALRGAVVTVTVDAATSVGSVTQVVLSGEGRVVAETNAPPYVFAWGTSDTGAGLIPLQAEVRTDAGESALSEIVHVIVYSDRDGDLLSDEWEYAMFGSRTNYNGTADPDGDIVNNLREFVADTQPTNATSFLRVTSFQSDSGSNVITATTSTSRYYEVQGNDSSTLDGSAWTAVSTNKIRGESGSTSWTDPVATTSRAYRVRVERP